MARVDNGIWLRLVVSGNTEITGFIVGAESPNDFFTTFKTHFVRIEQAVETQPSGRQFEHALLHVARDSVMLASHMDGPPGGE